MDFPLPEDDAPGENPAAHATQASGSGKRSFGDLENDTSKSKKIRIELEEATRMIVTYRESFQTFKDDLASCQNELEAVKAETEKWKSAFKKESFIPFGTSPEPQFVADYIQSLRASETSLKEQLEIAQMKLAICDLKDELKLKQASEQKTEVMVEKSESDEDAEADSDQGLAGSPSRHQHDATDVNSLMTRLARAEGTMKYFINSLGLLLRTQGIDPTNLLPTRVITLEAEAARDVEGATPSPVQSDLPQPVQAEHHSAEQPRG